MEIWPLNILQIPFLIRAALSVFPLRVQCVLLQLAHQEYVLEGPGLNHLGLLLKTHGLHLQWIHFFNSYFITIFLYLSNVLIGDFWPFVKTFLSYLPLGGILML